jgi:hypothetical protein
MLQYHPSKIEIRHLKWKNSDNIKNEDKIEYDYVSCHHYIRASNEI